MRVISIKRIKEFISQHSDAEASLLAWHDTIVAGTWANFADLKNTFKSADTVGERTVFNIAHNRYRLIAGIHYNKKRVFVLHILTHKEYDKGEWKR